MRTSRADSEQHRACGPVGAALLLGVLGSLVALELVVRLTGLDEAPLEVTLGEGTEPFARFDDAKGWVNLPGRGGNNRQGFRFPRDYARQPSTSNRLAILGDSQVWGIGVGADEHLAVLLDGRLDEAEVYGFGVPGYGPVQQLLVLRDLLVEYPFDEVFAVAFVYNDLVNESLSIDYGGLQKPYLRERAEGWSVENVPVPRPMLGDADASRIEFFGRESEMDFLVQHEGLARSSALYRTLIGQAARQRWLAMTLTRLGLARIVTERATVNEQYSIRRIDGRDVPCWHLEHCPPEHWLDGLAAVTAAYAEMDRLCGERGVRFTVILTPSYMELDRGISTVIDALASSLGDAGIRTLDLRASFHEQPHWEDVMGPTRHWTALGHALAADAVENDFRGRHSDEGGSRTGPPTPAD